MMENFGKVEVDGVQEGGAQEGGAKRWDADGGDGQPKFDSD